MTEDLTQVEKIAHTFTVLCEWPTAREQFKLESMYDPKLETHIGDKLWTDQQFSALKVSNNLAATTEDVLEKILEREGMLDLFSMETSSFFPIFSSNNSDGIEKELQRSAQNHGSSKNIETKYNF